MKQLGLLIRLIIGIIAGILIGMCGQWFGIADTAFFVTIIRLLATFTSLFSTFLSFMIPLIILSFITVGMAELGKKANRLFGLTLLLAYGTTVISGLLTFFIGKAVLPGLIQPITGDVLESNAFEPLFTITVDPIFGVMTADSDPHRRSVRQHRSRGSSGGYRQDVRFPVCYHYCTAAAVHLVSVWSGKHCLPQEPLQKHEERRSGVLYRTRHPVVCIDYSDCTELCI